MNTVNLNYPITQLLRTNLGWFINNNNGNDRFSLTNKQNLIKNMVNLYFEIETNLGNINYIYN